MQNTNFCIRLPYLKPNASVTAPQNVSARWLWPGLPFVQKHEFYWYEAEFPFARQMAERILNEMQTLEPEELRQALQMEQDNKRQAAWRVELEEIKNFGTGERIKTTGRNLGEMQAQKILLWRWLQETLWQELHELNNSWRSGNENLSACFDCVTQVETEDIVGELPEADWKIILAHALLFIPIDIPLLVEGKMAADFEDFTIFEEDAELAGRLNFPENGILRKSIFAPCEILNSNISANIAENSDFEQDRCWLIWSWK